MKTVNQDHISAVAWRACDTFRGTIDPAQYKDYILVMLFLKYLSDVWRDKREEFEKEFKGDTERVRRRLARERFIMPDGSDFHTLYAKRNEANIGELINVALEAIEDANKAKLEGVFRNIDFNSEANLVAPKKGSRIADPTCGSGSLLIQVADDVGDSYFSLYGQEMNGSTWALCRMNMLVRNKDAARIEWGDTLTNPKLIAGDSLMKFDVVVANPPFSLDKWGAESAEADKFHRFHRGVPPKSKGDYAFISHMIESAKEDGGRVGVIAPHGVLFRGGAEGRIRKAFLQENLLDAVIGLPEKLFFGTGIPAVILLFKRGRTAKDVLFIDASGEVVEGTNQNKLGKEHIAKIVRTYKAFETVPKFACRATTDEIAQNDFNLNIPRYVDTFEPENEVNLKAVQKEIETLEGQLADVRKEIVGYLKELG